MYIRSILTISIYSTPWLVDTNVQASQFLIHVEQRGFHVLQGAQLLPQKTELVPQIVDLGLEL